MPCFCRCTFCSPRESGIFSETEELCISRSSLRCLSSWRRSGHRGRAGGASGLFPRLSPDSGPAAYGKFDQEVHRPRTDQNHERDAPLFRYPDQGAGGHHAVPRCQIFHPVFPEIHRKNPARLAAAELWFGILAGRLIQPHFDCNAAAIRPSNSGCAFWGRDLNSGWNWQAMKYGWSCSSTISTRPRWGLVPLTFRPPFSSSAR